MPISIHRAEKLETCVLEYFPEAKITKKGKELSGYREISFTTGCVVASFLKAALTVTQDMIIKPTRSLEVEVTFF